MLSPDELAIIFSYLTPQHNIKNLNLVCKSWYEVSSVKEGHDSLLWKHWYNCALVYYASRTMKNYRRKWLLKRAKKESKRNYRILLENLIIACENMITQKSKHKFSRIPITDLPGKEYPYFNSSDLEKQLKLYKQLFSRNKQELEELLKRDKTFFNRYIIMLAKQHAVPKPIFEAYVELALQHDIPMYPNPLAEKHNKLPTIATASLVEYLLPTQILIFYGKFELAMLLHEKYGIPLTLKLGDNSPLSSQAVLLNTEGWISRRANRVKFTVQQYVDMLSVLIEKEGILPVYDISHNQPIFCTTALHFLVDCFNHEKAVPIMKVYLDRGADVNKKDATGRTPLELLYHHCSLANMYNSEYVYLTIKRDRIGVATKQFVNDLLYPVLVLFQERNAEMTEDLKHKFEQQKQRFAVYQETPNKNCLIS